MEFFERSETDRSKSFDENVNELLAREGGVARNPPLFFHGHFSAFRIIEFVERRNYESRESVCSLDNGMISRRKCVEQLELIVEL